MQGEVGSHVLGAAALLKLLVAIKMAWQYFHKVSNTGIGVQKVANALLQSYHQAHMIH